MLRDGKILSIMANQGGGGGGGGGGVAQISAHSCESVASTSNNHNFLIRTPIRAFLNSTESSFSLEFNKIEFSSKTWSEEWTVEEWSILVFGTFGLGTGLYLKFLELRMA